MFPGSRPETPATERSIGPPRPTIAAPDAGVPWIRDNRRMQRRDRVDADGYILPEADLANVQPEYAGVPEEAARLLVGELGSRLHSGYLYGSVVRGNAVPGRSDLDLVVVLRAPPSQQDRSGGGRVEAALLQRFPLLAGAGVVLTHLQEVRSPEQRYGMQVFLRELSVCICGQDLRPGLPRTRPSAAVAAGFHLDTGLVLDRARAALAASDDPEVVRRACRLASRRMVQGAFAVVMARDGVWATVLEEQAAAVAAAFPQWARAAWRAAEQGRRPVAEAAVVRELLAGFGRWVQEALGRVIDSEAGRTNEEGSRNRRMSANFINPEAIHPPFGYSHVVEVTAGRPVYIAGQVAMDRDGNLVGPGDIRAQARQVFENLKTALEAVGAGFEQVVKLNYYLLDASQLPAVREVRDQYVDTERPPASTAVEVRRLFRDGYLIEVEAVALVR
jgi:uncharacterized protein